MYEDRELPSLPAGYELQVHDALDSAVAEAQRLAAAGAEEGTLVWARSQTDARTRSGRPWESPRGNLHCALVIQPDYDNRTAQQLATVTAVAAGAGIAERVAPGTGLGFNWPGDLLINDLRAGYISISAAPGDADPYPWMVLGVNVNVAHHPENPEPERFNSINASGDAEHVRDLEVLEQFARHFLRWINIWADEGYAPVRNAWLQRAHDVGRPRRINFDADSVEGVVRGIGDHGELVLDDSSGQEARVSVARYFGL